MKLHSSSKLTEQRDFLRKQALALCSANKHREARRVLEDVLARQSELSADEIISHHLALWLIEWEEDRHERALTILLHVAPLVDATPDNLLKGKFNTDLALTRRKMQDFDGAFEAYDAALFWHKDARRKAEVENNIAFLFIEVEKPDEAHIHLDRALRMRPHDELFAAKIDETRSRAFLAQGMPERAVESARRAVEVLEQGHEPKPLLEARRTYVEALEVLHRSARRRMIEDALRLSDGAVSQAAKLLGMRHGSLQWMIRREFPELEGERKGAMKARGKGKR